MSTVLVAQYHSEIRSLITLLLRQQGYQVVSANDLADIRQQSLQHELGLVCLDIMFPGLDKENPLEIFQSGDMGSTLAETPVLLTDVNGLLEITAPGTNRGADGLYAPRTGRSRSFLEEVNQMLPIPVDVDVLVHSWRLDKKELPSFLFACFLFSINGVLTLNDSRIHKSIHFNNGWIRSASSSVESDWLGKMLLARHMITPTALNEVERALATSSRRIGQEFIARGYLNQKQLAEALNQQYASVVMSVFEWNTAEVTISDGQPNPAPHLMVHPFRLILSGLNLAFSEKEVDELLPPPEHYLSPTVWTSFRFAEAGLSEDEKTLLLSIDGQRRMKALIGSSPFPAESTKKFLLTLLIMRSIVDLEQPEDYPITFSSQIEGDSQAIIEDDFFRDDQKVITFDDLMVEEDADEDEEEDPKIFIDPNKPMTFKEHFALFEHLAAARYLVAVIILLSAFAVLFALYLRRDVARQFDQRGRLLEAGRTEMVMIKKPHFERADKLLFDAVHILKKDKWDGLEEAFSLIGGALDIDPEFNEAMNFRTSINFTIKARNALKQDQPEKAAVLLDQALKLFPENPLAKMLLAQTEGTPTGGAP